LGRPKLSTRKFSAWKKKEEKEEYYNTYHCVTVAYSIQYSKMLYRFAA
jgi:hypothetical protein